MAQAVDENAQPDPKIRVVFATVQEATDGHYPVDKWCLPSEYSLSIDQGLQSIKSLIINMHTAHQSMGIYDRSKGFDCRWMDSNTCHTKRTFLLRIDKIKIENKNIFL